MSNQVNLPPHGIKGIFFDLGGVLVDSEQWHTTAFWLAMVENKCPWPTVEQEKELVGLSTREKLDKIAPDVDYDAVYASKLRHMAAIVEENCKPITRVIDTVNYANSIGHTALVTNCRKQTVELILKKSRLEGRFDFVVTRDDVDGKVKPHQWPYLKAKYHFGLKCKEGLCIEDSLDGIMSAIDAGLRTWHVKGVEDLTVRKLMDVLTSYRYTI